jgi:type I restriction enzyme M protein
MKKTDVPRATLAQIRALVDAAVAGASTAPLLAKVTGFTAREVGYAIEAAATLGLVSRNGMRIEPTPLGRGLAETALESDEEAAIMRLAIEGSAALTRLAPGLLGDEPPTRRELARRIRQLTKLDDTAATNRATKILKWRRQLAGTSSPRAAPRNGGTHHGGMWRRIEIRNYRSIEHASVDLPPFAVIVGPNGSGKSNFADALVFARDIATDASAAVERRGGIAGVRRWRPTKPTDVTIDLRAAASKQGLDSDYVRHSFKIHSGAQGRFDFTEEAIEIVAKGVRKVWMERKRHSLTSNGRERLPKVQSTASAMVLAGQLEEYWRTAALRTVRRYRLNPDVMRRPQLSSDKARLEEDGANIAVAVREVRAAGRIADLLRAMAKIVPGLRDVKVRQSERYLTLEFEQEQDEGLVAKFNATEMSEGALRALGIIVATLQMVQNELLIIEEPEVSIHVGAAALLFDVLKEASESGAVLITTHSADLIDAAADEEILVCEYARGVTSIGPLASAQRAVVRDGLFSVAQLMRSEPLRIERTSRSGIERTSRSGRPER